MNGLDYFYDGQFRGYIRQIVRAFSGFQTRVGTLPDGSPKLRIAPVTYASQNSLVASILKNNSENTVLSVPQIAVYMTGVDKANERRQSPNYVDHQSVVEREIDPSTNKYTTARGSSYTVERFMPVPVNLTFQVDIWTSNLEQKCELLEQILVLFNPGLDIKTNNNSLDWTSLTNIELESVQWTNRGVPLGSSTELEIASLVLTVPAWINPPAKLTRHRVIEQIITNIRTLDDEDIIAANADSANAAIDWMQGDILGRIVKTPGDYRIDVEGNKITLLNGFDKNWLDVFELYGKYRPGTSQIQLKTTSDLDDHDTNVVGTFQVDDENPNVLHYVIDPLTLPMNNLPPIDAVIDPTRTFTGSSTSDLPPVQTGNRYLLTQDIVAGSTAWGSLTANTNDIIEYDGTKWVVAFDSKFVSGDYTLINSRRNTQLSWKNNMWLNTIGGEYNPGFWRLAL